MANMVGKTKQLTCTVCGCIFTGSLFASPTTARCEQCKKVGAKVGTVIPKSAIHDGQIKQIQDRVMGELPKPKEIVLNRNRQDIEGTIIMDTGEYIERIPARWKVINNKLDYLSVSKMQTYQQCPAKFNRMYMNNSGSGDDNGGNIFTWFGSILHEVMEISTRAFSGNGITLDHMNLFDEAWRKRQLTDLSMYREGRELIADYFYRHPVGSNSDKCLVAEYEWRGRLGGLIDDLPDEVRDMEFGCQFDYIGEINDDTAIIKDYKSNRHPYTQYELEESLQLMVYEIIARKMFPQYKHWITGYELFRFGWQQCPQRTPGDLVATKAFMVNLACQVVRNDTWEEKLNNYCGYCPLRSTCGAYCNYVTCPGRLIDTIITDSTDLSVIEKERENANIALKVLEGRKDELNKIMKTAVENAVLNGQSMVVDGKELYLQSQSRPSYNYNAVRNVMAMSGAVDILDQCISVNKTKLDKLTADNPQLAMELTRCIEQGYSAPYLLKKNYKPKK